jgi:hypothetical protein
MRLLLNTKAHWIYTREINPRHAEAVDLWRSHGRLIYTVERKKDEEADICGTIPHPITEALGLASGGRE